MRFIPWSNTDPDVAAYIAAVVAAGGTVTATQSAEINRRIREGKTQGWWTPLKRIYLPIWGVAAANAICMKSLTSGTFVGGVTHGAGFVQGDNSTGYFNSSTTLHSVGLNDKQGMFGVLSLDDLGTDNLGGLIGVSRMMLVNGTAVTSQMCSSSGTTAIVSKNFTGIFVASRTSATSHRLYRRSTVDGFESGTENTSTESQNLPNLAPWFVGAANNNTVPLRGTATSRQGSYFFGDALTLGQAQDFTAALKSLWETCTGLTLP